MVSTAWQERYDGWWRSSTLLEAGTFGQIVVVQWCWCGLHAHTHAGHAHNTRRLYCRLISIYYHADNSVSSWQWQSSLSLVSAVTISNFSFCMHLWSGLQSSLLPIACPCCFLLVSNHGKSIGHSVILVSYFPTAYISVSTSLLQHHFCAPTSMPLWLSFVHPLISGGPPGPMSTTQHSDQHPLPNDSNWNKDKMSVCLISSHPICLAQVQHIVTTMTVPTPVHPILTCLCHSRVFRTIPKHPLPSWTSSHLSNATPNPLAPSQANSHLSNTLPNPPTPLCLVNTSGKTVYAIDAID